ncbi:YhcN/YlaJ family sporulation lipoprotein [Virgibacillus sediminis]|uniref:YhcN/YlaJ family sporulation lipoprotein n=1 Tax=Virgibacillus sediminis TaxID=202260 RepID=A0ABV7AAV0_9BACI
MIIRMGILAMSLFVVLIGCQQNEEEEPLAQKDQGNNNMMQVENSAPAEREELNNTQIADRLANLANDVPNVEDATAVVAGPYAVVGIDVDKDLDRSRVGTIKYSVLEALYHDPYGKTAVVVADADGNERIRDMADKIRQGHPVQGVVDEVAAIVGRYMPDFPIDEDRAQEPDQNKQIIPENEERQLEEVEEEQSKPPTE